MTMTDDDGDDDDDDYDDAPDMSPYRYQGFFRGLRKISEIPAPWNN